MQKIIVVGATGLVGREILKILNEENVNISNIFGAASEKSEGMKVQYLNNPIISINNVEFNQYDIALFSAGSEISKIFVPKALAAGCIVIDNTSYYRMMPNVPLIVPEINLDKMVNSKLIANPNCSTIQMVLPLKPLHDYFNLQELVISTYQAAGGAGQKGIEELLNQTKQVMNNEKITVKHFKRQLAFNLIPQIDDFSDLEYTKEEWKMINETQKILNTNINITATCVRVPVLRGHAISVYAKFEKEIDINKVIYLISQFPGITIIDNPSKYEFATPIDSVNKNKVLISRIRKHPSIKEGLSFWCVADNIRKGAALNAVQIAKLFIK